MIVKKFLVGGVIGALLVSTSAYADAAVRPASSKVSAKIYKMSRARSTLDVRKTHDFATAGLVVVALAVAAGGVGVAGAAGAFNSSP